MVGTGIGRLTRPHLALVRRLSVVVVVAGLLVQLFAGMALASESRVLTEATCVDGGTWSGGSQINDGVWTPTLEGGVCTADWADVEGGDALTIPEHVTLNLAGGDPLQVDGGLVTNNGTIVTDSTVEVSGFQARLVNNGKVTAEGFFVFDGAEVTNNGTIDAGQVNIQKASLFNYGVMNASFSFSVGEDSEVDNYGEVNTYEFWLETDSTFLIRCGGVLNADVVNGHDSSSPTTNPDYRDPTFEDPCDDGDDDEDPPTTEPPSTEPPVIPPVVVETTTTTTMAPTTTTEAPTTTTIVEVLGLVVEAETLPMTGSEDAGITGLVAMAMVAVGLAALAASAAMARTED